MIESIRAMFEKLVNSCKYSIDGLRWAFSNELSFRLDLFFFSPFAMIALIFGRTYIEKSILITPIFLILICELINTSIEAICDHVSVEIKELIKVCKDVASAAVFLSIALFFLIWFAFLLTFL